MEQIYQDSFANCIKKSFMNLHPNVQAVVEIDEVAIQCGSADFCVRIVSK